MLIVFSLAALFLTCENNYDADRRTTDLNELVEKLQRQAAPDKRTDRIEPLLRGDTLSGYTTLKSAATELERFATYHQLLNEVRLLPDTSQGQKTYGLIKVATANLRSKPGHSQELATQALYGTPIRVLDKQGDWYLVRTPDRYLAWLEPGAFFRIDRAAYEAYLASELVMLEQPATARFDRRPGDRQWIALTAGALVRSTDRRADGTLLALSPEGHALNLELPAESARPLSTLAPALDVTQLLATARRFSGKPYLWGGTAPHGLDCSGFTKLSYQLNGFVIPRDASQQVHAGVEVELTEDFRHVTRGDLLFFGNLREDGSERITHVGFYVGDGRFLHAGADNGSIQENSLVEGSPQYNAERKRTLMRAKRLEPAGAGVVTLLSAFKRL